MNNFIWRLLDAIGGKILRRILWSTNKSKIPKEILAQQAEIEQQKYIQKVNYYNYLSLFYFHYLNRVTVFLASSVFLDYLIFFLPTFEFYKQLKLEINFALIFWGAVYLLIGVMIWEIQTIHKKRKAKSLLSSKAILFIILILLIFTMFFQVLISEEYINSPFKILMHVLFIIVTALPIVISIINASKQKNRPNISNLLLIIKYILPVIFLRVSHLLATISIVILQEFYFEYAIFSFILLIMILQKKPLVDRLVAPTHPKYRVNR